MGHSFLLDSWLGLESSCLLSGLGPACLRKRWRQRRCLGLAWRAFITQLFVNLRRLLRRLSVSISSDLSDFCHFLGLSGHCLPLGRFGSSFWLLVGLTRRLGRLLFWLFGFLFVVFLGKKTLVELLQVARQLNGTQQSWVCARPLF